MTFPLPLNISYCRQKIMLAIGTKGTATPYLQPHLWKSQYSNFILIQEKSTCIVFFIFWRKKYFTRYFVAAKFFISVMFSWWFSWCFRIINVYQYFFALTLNILLDEENRELGDKRKNILLDNIYTFFLTKMLQMN